MNRKIAQHMKERIEKVMDVKVDLWVGDGRWGLCAYNPSTIQKEHMDRVIRKNLRPPHKGFILAIKRSGYERI